MKIWKTLRRTSKPLLRTYKVCSEGFRYVEGQDAGIGTVETDKIVVSGGVLRNPAGDKMRIYDLNDCEMYSVTAGATPFGRTLHPSDPKLQPQSSVLKLNGLKKLINVFLLYL